MTSLPVLTLGAVAYDAKVVPIWDGFLRFFVDRGLPFDYILFTNYERQVEAHLAGGIDVAWNSPLAWIEAVRAAQKRGITATTVAMRDTDQDLRSAFLVRADGPADLAGLAGKKIGVGAGDSPQATLIPLDHLAHLGIEVEVVRHDVLVGKHGDHIGGERDAVRALLRGEVDAAAILDGNLLAFGRDGTVPAGSVRVVGQTGLYDHCNFTVLHEHPGVALFTELLMGMSFSDPAVRPLMELEGLTAWRPGRSSGYDLLERAIDRFGTIEPWLFTS